MKTKIKSKNKLYKKITIILISLIVVSGLIFAVLEKLHITDFMNNDTPKVPDNVQSIDNNPPTQEQIDAGKKNPDVVQNNDLGISITLKDASSDPIRIKSNITGAITNNGTCTLVLTNNGVEVTKTAKTFALPSYSTCVGFDIPKSELSSGTWQIKLSVDVNTKQSSVTDSFSLE